MIGRAYVNGTLWEVWADGHAYADVNMDHDHWQRHESGHWAPYEDLKRVSKPRKSSYKDWVVYSEVSETLERVYLKYLNSLIAGDDDGGA